MDDKPIKSRVSKIGEWFANCIICPANLTIANRISHRFWQFSPPLSKPCICGFSPLLNSHSTLTFLSLVSKIFCIFGVFFSLFLRFTFTFLRKVNIDKCWFRGIYIELQGILPQVMFSTFLRTCRIFLEVFSC